MTPSSSHSSGEGLLSQLNFTGSLAQADTEDGHEWTCSPSSPCLSIFKLKQQGITENKISFPQTIQNEGNYVTWQMATCSKHIGHLSILDFAKYKTFLICPHITQMRYHNLHLISYFIHNNLCVSPNQKEEKLIIFTFSTQNAEDLLEKNHVYLIWIKLSNRSYHRYEQPYLL